MRSGSVAAGGKTKPGGPRDNGELIRADEGAGGVGGGESPKPVGTWYSVELIGADEVTVHGGGGAADTGNGGRALGKGARVRTGGRPNRGGRMDGKRRDADRRIPRCKQQRQVG